MLTRRSIRSSRAFSLVEVLASLTILGLAAAALLLANETTSRSMHDAIAETIARGIADQVLDDVAGMRYVESGESETVLPLGSESGEARTPLQMAAFDDIDDFHGINQSPPLDRWGVALGQGDGAGGLRAADFRISDEYLANWQVTVSITYVNETDPAIDLTGSSTSGMRAATVTISKTVDGVRVTLAQVRRVFSYVPSL